MRTITINIIDSAQDNPTALSMSFPDYNFANEWMDIIQNITASVAETLVYLIEPKLPMEAVKDDVNEKTSRH